MEKFDEILLLRIRRNRMTPAAVLVYIFAQGVASIDSRLGSYTKSLTIERSIKSYFRFDWKKNIPQWNFIA